MKLQRVLAILLVLLVCSCAYADDVYDYASSPEYRSPYYEGCVKSAVLNDALDELNYIRSLIGVPSSVTLNDEYTDKAQHGAVLLDVIGTLTHMPSRPANMTLSFYDMAYDALTHSNIAGAASGNMSLSKSLKIYMDDSDSSNINALSHRRWLMNPRLEQVGFGLSTRKGYAAAYVIEEISDSIPAWPLDDVFITWPSSKKAHPLTYFYHDTAWSVTLDGDVFDECSEEAVQVTLTRESDNRTWTFSSSHKDGYFRVNTENYAYDDCIIFRPDNISRYNNNEVWNVKITGLTRSGVPSSISYSVRFTDSRTGYEDNYSADRSRGNNRIDSDSGGGCNSGFGLLALTGLIIGIRRIYSGKIICAGK
ncbi:MAG: hypothetical protein IJR35_03935 [Synergistaceae bacterium]|nr:hypothetical protein [Synergistaceae bacterium]MBQ9594987.1 hypothetical protein [Synergistaceae bacterium]